MRLDHLLSKEEKSRGWVYCLVIKDENPKSCKDPRKQSFLGRGKPRVRPKRGTSREASFPAAICFVHVLTMITKFPVPMRPGDTPVPIPNTMVKPRTADGTMLETAWESRWAPESLMGV